MATHQETVERWENPQQKVPLDLLSDLLPGQVVGRLTQVRTEQGRLSPFGTLRRRRSSEAPAWMR